MRLILLYFVNFYIAESYAIYVVEKNDNKDNGVSSSTSMEMEDYVKIMKSSDERLKRQDKKNAEVKKNPDTNNKIIAPSVKKPIPKFNELNEEDDGDLNNVNSSWKFTDSIEHEDEDFSLDDYDFDINHDEFSGRGKPLEPRIKKIFDTIPKVNPVTVKQIIQPSEPLKKEQPKDTIKRQVSLNVYVRVPKTIKVIDKSKIDDYYDDTTSTTTKKVDVKNRSDDYSSETSEVNKDDSKLIRSIRSSNKCIRNKKYKLNPKRNKPFTNDLRFLPMFPVVKQSPDTMNWFKYHSYK